MSGAGGAGGAGADRYARQTRFAPIGAAGQRHLAASSAVIVGMGALGCVAGQHLARAGVGRLRLIDRDIVERTNLQRQMLYTEEDADQSLPKAEAAALRLRAVNSEIAIEARTADLTSANADDLLSGFDVLIDGTDNFAVRYLLNDFALSRGVPWIYGGAVGAGGMTMAVVPGETPCYRCLFPDPPAPGTTDTCETTGVISPIVDIIASFQAAEALKLLTGRRDMLHGSLLQIDAWDTRLASLRVKDARRADCPACGGVYEFLTPGASGGGAATLCGRETVQITPPRPLREPLAELAGRLQAAGRVELNPYLLRLQLAEGIALALFPDGRALVQGTEDVERAKAIYERVMAP